MGQNTLDDVRALALSHGEDPEAVNAALKVGHTLDEIANHFAPDQDSAIEAAAYGGAGAAAVSALKSGIGGGHQLLHKLVQEASKPAPQVSPQVAPQAAPVVETPIAPIDIPKPPIVGEDLSGKELWNQKLTGTSGPGSQMDAESLAKNRGTMNAARDASGRMQGSTVSDQGFIIGPEERARRELLAKNRSMAHPAQIQNAANEAALQNEARMTTQLKAAKAAKDAEAASLSGKIKAVTTPIKNAANTVANIPGVKQAGKAAQWVSDLPVIGHALAGAGVAGEAQDAYNRFQNDDYLGGSVSGLGALGSAASVFPVQPPWLRGAEAGLGMGAPLLNIGIDYVKKKFAEGGEVGPAPSEGGINYRDYPNPYQNPNINGGGLRAYLKSDGTYGGEMIPKSTGLLGELQGTGPNAGKSMTEYSIGDETGDYPSLVPTLNSEDIKNVLNGNITPEVAKKAREWSDTRKSHGMSPFYNPPGFAEGGEVDTTLPPVSVSAPRPSQSEMKAYLATHDENTGAPKDALGDFFSGKANLSDSLTQAGKELSNFPKSTTPNKVPSLDDPEVQAAMAFAPMGLGVIKNPGGTWLPDAVNELTWDAKARLEHTPAAKYVKNWYDTVLNKYVQNRMGSPSDEIRKLADQGISHIPASRLEAAHANIGPDRIVKSARTASGFPEEGLATSPLGKLWEDVSDSQIESKPIKFISSGAASEMPGIEKLSPEDLVHYNSGLNPENLGFRHIGDMLQSDINAGKLTPEQLAQMSVEKAVRRTQNFNKTQAQAQETAQQSLPTVKDYPTGFTWKELTHSDPDTLDAILKKEGDTMQNCIGGYGADVIDDGTKLYSLRDPAGNPHANIEVRPGEYGPNIRQIKGKQNEAPNENYQTYIQDFIQNPHTGQEFNKVGDLENTGLMSVEKLKEHGLADLPPGAGQSIDAELNRIHPRQPGQFGGFEASGQHGNRVTSYQLMKNLTQDLPGNYVNEQQLLNHLQGKEARPVEESYSNFYDQPK